MSDRTKASHVEVLEHASEVFPRLRKLMSESTHYVMMVGPTGKCRTCGNVDELRFGHCHACAAAADPDKETQKQEAKIGRKLRGLS